MVVSRDGVYAYSSSTTKCNIIRGLHYGAGMMSRLQSEDPAIAEPTQAVDTEVPCFALAI
jgi:hypothetical protein